MTPVRALAAELFFTHVPGRPSHWPGLVVTSSISGPARSEAVMRAQVVAASEDGDPLRSAVGEVLLH